MKRPPPESFPPPPVDYPEGHSPFCPRNCDHPCHDTYDLYAESRGNKTFEDFMAQVARELVPEHRAGQTAFNLLYLMHPVLAERVRGTEVDPYYIDERLDAFYEFINEHWSG